ncbi:hypothetical protein Tco_1412493 [Tanacetum coccineum]
MTCSTTKKLMKPLKEPKRKFHRCRRAIWRQHQNESLAIAGRNLFEDEASSSTNDRVKGAHEADECDQNEPPKQVCLSGGDIYDEPSLLRFYQNDDISPWGNSRQKKEGEKGPKWVVKSKFGDDLSRFMLKKKLPREGIRRNA